MPEVGRLQLVEFEEALDAGNDAYLAVAVFFVGIIRIVEDTMTVLCRREVGHMLVT